MKRYEIQEQVSRYGWARVCSAKTLYEADELAQPGERVLDIQTGDVVYVRLEGHKLEKLNGQQMWVLLQSIATHLGYSMRDIATDLGIIFQQLKSMRNGTWNASTQFRLEVYRLYGDIIEAKL